MAKKNINNNKQTKKQKKKLTNEQKRNFEIIGFSCSIILLVLVLFGILKINTKVKSETEDIMSQFYKYYESEESKVIYYYNSIETSDKKSNYELDYLVRISKDYKIDFLTLDMSKLNTKNREEIESTLGINSVSPTTIVVKNKNIIAVQEGFIESNKLVDMFVDANLLEKGSKYVPVDNLKFIDYETYLKLLDNDDANVVIVGEAGCEYCISVKPILNNISKAYKIDINYLDVSDMNQEQLKEFFDHLPDLGYNNEKLETNGTFSMPTMLIIKDGKITSYLEEVKSLEEYISYLRENDIIE